MHYNDKNERRTISSPKSLEACKRQGVTPSELMFVDFETFRNSTFELKNMSKELVEIRFNELEKLRLDTIQKVAEARKKIAEEHETIKSKISVHF